MANDTSTNQPSIFPRRPPEPDEDRPTEIVERPDEVYDALFDAGEIVEVVRADATSSWNTSTGEDPATIARRVAEQARARTMERKMSTEDPRELARRLAEEAKRRIGGATPPPASPSARYEPEDDDGAWDPVADEVEPEIVIGQTAPAAERAGVAARPMSALEALNAARERERKAGVTPAPAAPRSAPAPAPAPAPRATGRSAVPAVSEALPGAEVETSAPVENVEVFRAVWRAHRSRAAHQRDLALVATASVLLDAIERVPRGALLACAVRFGAERVAAWVDADRGVLLAVASPPEVYLS